MALRVGLLPQPRQVVMTGAGTAWTIPITFIAGSETIIVGNIVMQRVASSPSQNTYTISGSSVTFGFSVPGGTDVFAFCLV